MTAAYLPQPYFLAQSLRNLTPPGRFLGQPLLQHLKYTDVY